ncbi:UDP-3-O-[3-hydroxymyristoyl] glucosamine N-acyltransferase [hydrothermal vent metagenome]|uniref:UDP-3-O-[3-hydroxymyristoyl] glucosamine N-acyltransferase n=1 Tax=hydrothermal vent metagenome TaxID=652676 RepID=A0A3B1BI08_9ZZZZ
MKLGEIAAALECRLEGSGALNIVKASSFENAGPEDIALALEAPKTESGLGTGAGALIAPDGVKVDRPALIVKNPLLALAKTMNLLQPENLPPAGIDDTAIIGKDVALGEGCHVGAYATIGAASKIGDGAVIKAGARIGANCLIGKQSVIFENVVVYDKTEIGDRTRIHANSVIGSDGFGYTKLESGANFKIPQHGIVRIEDDVEIGASCAIDRATLDVTLIKSGVKIDNQVQIAHNCVIGENTVIAGCTGIAGSVTIGKGVMIGGMVAVSDHLNIADGVMIAGKTGVHTNLSEPGVYAGPMAMKNMEYKRFLLSGKRIDKISAKLKELAKLIKKS